jgi:hypothetical protein
VARIIAGVFVLAAVLLWLARSYIQIKRQKRRMMEHLLRQADYAHAFENMEGIPRPYVKRWLDRWEKKGWVEIATPENSQPTRIPVLDYIQPAEGSNWSEALQSPPDRKSSRGQSSDQYQLTENGQRVAASWPPSLLIRWPLLAALTAAGLLVLLAVAEPTPSNCPKTGVCSLMRGDIIRYHGGRFIVLSRGGGKLRLTHVGRRGKRWVIQRRPRWYAASQVASDAAFLAWSNP